MDVKKVVEAMTPEIYQSLLTAVETGRWADGNALTAAQKDNVQQMVILYQSQHNHCPEHFTVGTDGELVVKSKQELKRQFREDEVIFSERPEDD
ncbi:MULTISPECIES: YeaC family protein [Aliagarivorans]|uniref:YeaC family protein n=1 Tax=Aliagarivorans TaxID=882379 RepID=UPI0003FCA2B7|nr:MULTISPECIES: DUF1315 family protein [Aliagarivorans]